MAEPNKFTIEIEYIEPSNIECEVPGDQKLREDDETTTNAEKDAASNDLASLDSNLEEGFKDDDSNKFVYAPVITVTKEEASYTKGDLKLQKVSVDENISDQEPGINGAVFYTINSNPNIHSDVIHAHPVRVQDDDRADDKPKTRIPMMRFKNAAEKVKTNRRASLDKKDEIPPSRLTQKRSSIPRLQRRASKPETKAETAQPDDEFDKLYHEIVDNDPKEILIESIEVKVEDPVKLENKFEEIIHDYEENKVQPINVDKKHTKIPLFQRKSEQEIKISKPIEKVLVKTSEKANKEETKSDKNETRIPIFNDVPHKPARIKFNNAKTETYSPKSNVKLPTKIREPEIKKQVALPERSKEIDSKPKLDSIVVKNRDSGSNIKENSNDVLIKPISQKPYLEENPSIADTGIDVKSDQPLDELKNSKIDSVIVITSKEFEKKIKENNHDFLTKPKHAVQRSHSEDSPENVGLSNVKDIKMKQSGILPKTGYKSTPKEPLNENDNEAQTKGKAVVDTNINKNNLITNPKEIVMDEPNVVVISEIELKPEQIITVEYASDNLNEEDVILGKPTEINEKNHPTNIIEDSDDNEYTPGKVSRLLKRIRSKEFTIQDVEKETHKKEIVEIPKKKSVLSKIAMFEHHEILETPKSKVPPVPKSPTKSLFKDRSLDTDRKPIIVDELLKSTEKHKPYNVRIENLTVEEPEQSNSEENSQKNYVVEIVDESVKYHEVQFIKNLETEIQNIEDTKELLIIKDDAVNPPTSIATSKVEPNPIRNEVQIMEPINTDYLKPPIQNVEEKMPINEVMIESLDYKPIQYEFKDEILADDDAEVFSNEKQNRRPRRFHSRQESRMDRQKSVAETDLGNVVKGRVHEMILRMNSKEILDNHKKEIDSRERPRKKSVSKIIALFERPHLKKILLENERKIKILPKPPPHEDNKGFLGPYANM